MKVAESVASFVRRINGGCFCKVSYATKNHALLKTSKVDGTTNPFWAQKDQIRKVVDNCQINLGVVYKNAVNGRLEKRDIEPDFVSQPMRGKVECDKPHKNLCTDEKTHTKTYIRYMPMAGDSITVRYMLNGNDITDQVMKFKPVKKPTKTQESKGLEEKDQIMWRTLDTENVVKFEGLGMVIE